MAESTNSRSSDSGSSATASPAPVDLDAPTFRGDIIAASLCLCGGLVGFFFVVPEAVYVPAKFAGTANSPAFLPNVLFLLLAGFSVIYLIHSLANYVRAAPQGRVRTSDWKLAGGTALICAGYVAAMFLVGMTLGSALCVAVTMYYFGERRLWVIGAITVILPTLLWYFFVKIANILLPRPLLNIMEWLEAAVSPAGGIELAGLISPLVA